LIFKKKKNSNVDTEGKLVIEEILNLSKEIDRTLAMTERHLGEELAEYSIMWEPTILGKGLLYCDKR
jgi:hypothetical protein